MHHQKSYVNILISLIIFFTLAVIPISLEAGRGLGISKSHNTRNPYYRKSWAVIIGINNYTKWPHLDYAEHDAKGMKETLSKFGFDNFLELYNENATKQNIMKMLGDELGNPEKVNEDDRVIVFFAGHGQTRSLPNGRSLGYIIPVKADVENYSSTAISMTNLRDFCELIPAKHLLFIMDCCYSGLALSTRGGPKSRVRNYIKEITRRRARQIITAGGADEEVADGGPGNHSVFTGYLIRALNEHLADMDNNGIITTTELAAFITPQVKEYSNQTPAFGNLIGNEGGDMVFIYGTGNDTSQESGSSAFKAYKRAQETNTIKAWQAFLSDYPNSDFSEDANLSLKILKSKETSEELAEKAKLAQEINKKKIYLRQLEEKSFQSARNANNIDAWNTYLKDFTSENTDHIRFAKRQLELLKKPRKKIIRPKPTPIRKRQRNHFNLFHDQPAFAFAGKRKSIKVMIEGNWKLVRNATLFYGRVGRRVYKSKKMRLSRGVLTAYIPKQALAPNVIIRYFIQVADRNGKIKKIASRAHPLKFKVKRSRKQKVAPVINF